MLRSATPPDDATLLIRAVLASAEDTVMDIARAAADAAEVYDVELVGERVALYGVSVFARSPAVGLTDLLQRFAGAPYFLEATVGELQAVGLRVLPTGANPAHFEVLLVDRSPGMRSLSAPDLEPAARRLVDLCGDPHPNPFYAGDDHD